jgi:hypothetical protein
MAEKDDAVAAAAKEHVKKSTEAKAKAVEEATKRMSGRPTPTQEECDLAAVGQTVQHKEDDGSGPDPYISRTLGAVSPSSHGGGYHTRQQHAGGGGASKTHSTSASSSS